ncbi:methyltransferase [Clostridium tetani]|uniref:Methyltransferase n=1 Tax=Clostridium tetani TaxID=1513 RepID=A0A4Q0VAB4_CLOTA|nr:16S rRNA (guanine(966)-N(2))-methyltransferase RsmD [Clostridium tetani]RXI47630.1 16S rRNA (guanine(966)-N(2))-methyltransferase RsmD [Clostridium tetani]BDR66868.1 methyltransferase [Clostridium tetani]BDR72356.1 methyltransferase [Clostridium tetani]BDR80831.1 methyltransferase [Clostridium tetani]BDR89288.1 methyltransferase [Clostridium tetani]
MRIIAGSARGRKILPPEGMNTRPTLDRVKENIFNMIQVHVYGAKTLDLFAGTGSLGLEAVSRGASECYLIDRFPKTYSSLETNVKNLGFEDKCKCLNMDSYDALTFLKEKGEEFDLIFIDPPYLKDMVPSAIEKIDEYNLLKEDGIISIKIDSKEEIFEGSEHIKLVRIKRYGNTTVCFYRHKED